MDDTITTIYCLCDDLLKAMGHRDDPQVHLSSAEVMTVSLVAATFFGANIDKTRRFLNEYEYMPKTISKGRFNPTTVSTPSSPCSGKDSSRCWSNSSSSAIPNEHKWWTLCPSRYATTSASGAVGFIRPKSTEGCSAAISLLA